MSTPFNENEALFDENEFSFENENENSLERPGNESTFENVKEGLLNEPDNDTPFESEKENLLKESENGTIFENERESPLEESDKKDALNTVEEEVEDQLKEDDLFVTEENEIEDTIKDDFIPEIPNIKDIINLIFGNADDELDDEDIEFEELDQLEVDFISQAKQTIKKILSIVKQHEKKKSQEDDGYYDSNLSRKNKKRKRAPEPQQDKLTDEELDYMASSIVDSMNDACELDRKNNKERKMALNKLEMLPDVLEKLTKNHLRDKLIRHGVLSVIRKWLEPLPDKTIPNIKIREGMLKILENMPMLSEFVIKQSGIGRIVMFIYKTDPERIISQMAKSIIDRWSKQIFERNDSHNRSESFYHQKRPSQKSTSFNTKLKETDLLANKTTETPNKTKVYRAQIPEKTSFDFVYQPESSVTEAKSKTKQSWDLMKNRKLTNRADRKSVV